jgi:hypothetical protein
MWVDLINAMLEKQQQGRTRGASIFSPSSSTAAAAATEDEDA